MYVCLCHGVNEQQIRRLRDQGCRTLRTLQSKCGAGTNCGACLSHVKEVLNEKSSKSAAKTRAE